MSMVSSLSWTLILEDFFILNIKDIKSDKNDLLLGRKYMILFDLGGHS